MANEARLRLAEAHRMMHVPPRFPFVRSREMLRPRSVATIAEMFVLGLTLRRVQRLGPKASMPGYDELRGTFEYIEHLIRIGAVFQGLAERLLPGRALQGVAGVYWRWILKMSHRAGYAFGISNAKKYLLRRTPLEDREAEVLSVLALYELAPSPTGQSIHYRDVADVAVSRIGRARFAAEKVRLRQEAVDLYEKAIDAACEAGDPSLELKVMAGLKGVDPRRRWPRPMVEALVDSIQSPAFRRMRRKLVDLLIR